MRGLQKMPHVCDDFANEYILRYMMPENDLYVFLSKIFMQRYICIPLWGQLSWSYHVKHLSNTLSHELSEYEVQMKRGHF